MAHTSNPVAGARGAAPRTPTVRGGGTAQRMARSLVQRIMGESSNKSMINSRTGSARGDGKVAGSWITRTQAAPIDRNRGNPTERQGKADGFRSPRTVTAHPNQHQPRTSEQATSKAPGSRSLPGTHPRNTSGANRRASFHAPQHRILRITAGRAPEPRHPHGSAHHQGCNAPDQTRPVEHAIHGADHVLPISTTKRDSGKSI